MVGKLDVDGINENDEYLVGMYRNGAILSKHFFFSIKLSTDTHGEGETRGANRRM